MTEHQDVTEVEWVDVSGTEFGAAMPNGSCNAVTDKTGLCGFPRRADGTCINGHPAQPSRPATDTMRVTWVGPFRPEYGRAGDIWNDPETGRHFILGATPDQDVRTA